MIFHSNPSKFSVETSEQSQLQILHASLQFNLQDDEIVKFYHLQAVRHFNFMYEPVAHGMRDGIDAQTHYIGSRP